MEFFPSIFIPLIILSASASGMFQSFPKNLENGGHLNFNSYKPRSTQTLLTRLKQQLSSYTGLWPYADASDSPDYNSNIDNAIEDLHGLPSSGNDLPFSGDENWPSQPNIDDTALYKIIKKPVGKATVLSGRGGYIGNFALVFYPNVQRRGSSGEVPKWSSFVNKINYFYNTVKQHLMPGDGDLVNFKKLPLDYDSSDFEYPWVQYTALIQVISDLIEEVYDKGKNAYDEIFFRTMSLAAAKIYGGPRYVTRVLVNKMNTIYKNTEKIRAYINEVMSARNCHNTAECDSYIDNVVVRTKNSRLKYEAKLLQALVNVGDIFREKYAYTFEKEAYNINVHRFLYTQVRYYPEYLKDLVFAGCIVEDIIRTS